MDYENQNNNAQNPTPGLAIASLVLGIVSILFGVCFAPITFVLAIVGYILGRVSIRKGLGGRGMAIAGIVLSAISILVAVLFLAVFGLSLLSYS